MRLAIKRPPETDCAQSVSGGLNFTDLPSTSGGHHTSWLAKQNQGFLFKDNAVLAFVNTSEAVGCTNDLLANFALNHYMWPFPYVFWPFTHM